MTTESVYDFQPDAKNPRIQSAKGKELLRKSLKELGAARSIVVDRDNNVIAGHGTVQAAKEIDLTKTRVIETTGDELVVVRRMDIGPDDLEKRMALNLADNAASDMSTYDVGAIESVMADFGANIVGDWLDPDDNLIFQGALNGEKVDLSGISEEDEDVEAAPPSYKDDEDPTTRHTCPKCGFGFN